MWGIWGRIWIFYPLIVRKIDKFRNFSNFWKGQIMKTRRLRHRQKYKALSRWWKTGGWSKRTVSLKDLLMPSEAEWNQYISRKKEGLNIIIHTFSQNEWIQLKGGIQSVIPGSQMFLLWVFTQLSTQRLTKEWLYNIVRSIYWHRLTTWRKCRWLPRWNIRFRIHSSRCDSNIVGFSRWMHIQPC